MLSRVTRQRIPLAANNGRAAVRVTRLRQVRNYAVETGQAADASVHPSAPPAPKKRRFVRRVLLYTSVLGVGFYGASTTIALNNTRYHHFFVESVPLGETVLDLAESQGWDQTLSTGVPKQIVEVGGKVYTTVEGAISRLSGSAPPPSPPEKQPAGQQAPPGSKSSKERLRTVAQAVVTKVEKNAEKAPHTPKEVVQEVKQEAIKFSEGIAELVKEAEAALAGKPYTRPPSVAVGDEDATIPIATDKVAEESASETAPGGQKVYTAPLPLGFQPPPGYVLPAPPKPAPKSESKEVPASAPLPVLAPSVDKFSASEPIIAHLAGTIDKLATFVQNNPNLGVDGAKDVLKTAETDLTDLGERINALKEEEKRKLEEKLDDQAREFNLKMLELEADAQDKIDRQEEDWKTTFEEERSALSDAYRRKLEAELATQSEIINQRLKEEVVAQGIELQRRWIREIKVRVEQERGGRLAKLEDLATNVKRLERVTLDNSAYIDENVSIHALWSAIRALAAVIDAPTRKPFREELRVLQNVASARSDPVLSAALETLNQSDAPDVGVEPLADLATWFLTGVAPKVENVSLVPDQSAGVLSHVASIILSKFKFKRSGLVEGNDVSSVLARAEYYINEKDLDSAARELNQLNGWPKTVLTDWLKAARKRLEVQQALDVVQTEATLASLLVL